LLNRILPVKFEKWVVDSADEDESAGSASQQITDDETVQEDTLDMDTSQHTEEIENLNPVRRSTRERRQPSWLRSGEFIKYKRI
jgi:hypothetical protein